MPTDGPPPPEPFQRLDLCNPFPYTRSEYARRFAWELVQSTVFRWLPRRAYASRRALLRAFGARVGGNVRIRPRVSVLHPWLLEVGDWSSVAEDVVVYNLGPVRIGRQTAVSHGAYLCAGTHDYAEPDLPLVRAGITIGDGVWVAAQAFVGPGVTVGDNAVVGARAVAMADVPADMVVAGNPARVIKPRRGPVGGRRVGPDGNGETAETAEAKTGEHDTRPAVISSPEGAADSSPGRQPWVVGEQNA